MLRTLWSAVQGLVEYGAATGQSTGVHGGPGGRLTDWAADNRAVLIGGAAALLIIWLFRAARR